MTSISTISNVFYCLFLYIYNTGLYIIISTVVAVVVNNSVSLNLFLSCAFVAVRLVYNK